jgi:hypothetical protein
MSNAPNALSIIDRPSLASSGFFTVKDVNFKLAVSLEVSGHEPLALASQ